MSGRGDRSLAPERTALAWSRTALGVLVVAGLLVRLAERGGAPVASAAAAFAVLVAAGAWRHGHRRRGPGAGALTGAGARPYLRRLGLGVGALAALGALVVVLALTRP